MKIFLISISMLFFQKTKCQEINFPLSTDMTTEKSGRYNKNSEIQNVFEIVNLADGGSHGSGFLIRGGIILTNWHVVKKAEPEQIKVRTSEGFEKSIKSIIIDSIKDLAILTPYTPIKGGFEFEADDSILVGNQIYSWGFPFQYSTALLTVGYISGFRIYTPDRSYPQKVVKHIVFNGAFNPGNSGGPMIDARGKIVGMVQSKAIPIPSDATNALATLAANETGIVLDVKDSRGLVRELSEAQLVALVLYSYQNIAQVMIGEGVTIEEIKDFLRRNLIGGY